jgi:hypothetical protein
MRIDEIIQPRERTQNVPFTWDDEKLKQKHNKALGFGSKYNPSPSAGFYSQGYDVRDPFMYGKVSHLPTELEQDGFYQYTQLIKPIMDSNPYVPRIYSIKLIKDKNGRIRPDYRMEKLVHGQTLSKEIIHAMGTRTLGTEEWYKYEYDETDALDLWRELCKSITLVISAWPRKLISNISLEIDPLLIQVAKLIKMAEIKNKYLEIDLHQNNYMVRPGTVPHIVISDPLATE